MASATSLQVRKDALLDRLVQQTDLSLTQRAVLEIAIQSASHETTLDTLEGFFAQVETKKSEAVTKFLVRSTELLKEETKKFLKQEESNQHSAEEGEAKEILTTWP